MPTFIRGPHSAQRLGDLLCVHAPKRTANNCRRPGAEFLGVACTIAELRALTDEQLIAEHDACGIGGIQTVTVGVQYVLDEIRRREADKAQAAAYELSRRAYWLTVANSVLVAVSVVTAITAILHRS